MLGIGITVYAAAHVKEEVRVVQCDHCGPIDVNKTRQVDKTAFTVQRITRLLIVDLVTLDCRLVTRRPGLPNHRVTAANHVTKDYFWCTLVRKQDKFENRRKRWE